MTNSNLSKAKDAKNDEFYTPLTEIQKEVSNYIDKFENKVVFCNCDDPFESNFVKYFLMNFNRLKLKELIATGYLTSPVGGTEIGSKNQPYALRVKSTTKYLVGTQKDLDVRGAKYFLETEGDKIMTPLIGNFAHDSNGKRIEIEESVDVVDDNGNPVLTKAGKPKKKKIKKELYYEAGDFRSNMSVELLKQSDIVCTNPPFSLFREYVAQLMSNKKQFLILGNLNAITYKEFFPLLKDNKVWIGCKSMGTDMYFHVSDEFAAQLKKEKKEGSGYVIKNGEIMGRASAIWFTTLDHAKRHIKIPLDLGFTYYGHEDMYPKYDNYDAINVDKVVQIPCDYEPCWYKCPHADVCKYAQTEGKEDEALCEKKCNGEIGVPISFLDKHNSEQFEIVGADVDLAEDVELEDGKKGTGRFYLNDDCADTHTHTHTHASQETLQQNCHQKDQRSVMELSESQSASSISTVRNSSEFSALQTDKTATDTESINTPSMNILTPMTSMPELVSSSEKFQKRCTPEFSFKKCNGVIGVPISFLDKYCPGQFEIIGMCENLDLYGLKTRIYTTEECRNRYKELFGKKGTYDLNAAGVINGYKVYQRILIRKVQELCQ